MDRIGKHAEADPSGKRHGHPQWHPWCSSLDHWKRACRQVVPPVRGTEAVWSRQDAALLTSSGIKVSAQSILNGPTVRALRSAVDPTAAPRATDRRCGAPRPPSWRCGRRADNTPDLEIRDLRWDAAARLARIRSEPFRVFPEAADHELAAAGERGRPRYEPARRAPWSRRGRRSGWRSPPAPSPPTLCRISTASPKGIFRLLSAFLARRCTCAIGASG